MNAAGYIEPEMQLKRMMLWSLLDLPASRLPEAFRMLASLDPLSEPIETQCHRLSELEEAEERNWAEVLRLLGNAGRTLATIRASRPLPVFIAAAEACPIDVLAPGLAELFAAMLNAERRFLALFISTLRGRIMCTEAGIAQET